MDINIVKLMILVHMEKYKKVTDVAREMNMKQPSVTFHMKSLEEELGTILFESKRGRMLLTEAGKALYPYALKITGLATEARKVIQDFTLLDKGILRIGADWGSGIYPLPELITAFTTRYTGIQLHVTIQPTQMIRTMLKDRNIDIAIIHSSEHQFIKDESTIIEPLLDDELVIIFGRNHRFSNMQEVETQHVGEEFFIQHAEGTFVKTFTDKWSDNNNIHVWERMQMDCPETIKLAVQAGNYITFFPKQSVQLELELGTLKYLPIPENMNSQLNCVIATQQDSTQHSLRNEFVDFARNYTFS
ncbi:LysR family transcriptional regulator [Paenibacillus sp. CMAA1364]